jgi:hypothetical protein
MKTFTIIANIDTIIDVLDTTLVLPIYLPTIYGDWILFSSSIKKLLRWPKSLGIVPLPVHQKQDIF